MLRMQYLGQIARMRRFASCVNPRKDLTLGSTSSINGRAFQSGTLSSHADWQQAAGEHAKDGKGACWDGEGGEGADIWQAEGLMVYSASRIPVEEEWAIQNSLCRCAIFDTRARTHIQLQAPLRRSQCIRTRQT